MGMPEHQKCADCGEPILSVMQEPGGHSMRLDPTPKRLWRLVPVSPDYAVAVTAEVYESHVATCKKLNPTQ